MLRPLFPAKGGICVANDGFYQNTYKRLGFSILFANFKTLSSVALFSKKWSYSKREKLKGRTFPRLSEAQFPTIFGAIVKFAT